MSESGQPMRLIDVKVRNMEREDAYFQAMISRDHRFDGKFFVGVKTTGIYCRPICPARPQRQNVEFFDTYIDAEKAGYRGCLRCRPESAPHSPAWIGKSALVQRAIKVIHNHETISLNENMFAQKFGISARHLRRIFVDEVGRTPKQLSIENRLNLSKKLITETSLPLSNIAFAAGFNSLRRFNDAFKKRFHTAPTLVRRNKLPLSSGIRISLPYRPPIQFEALLETYKAHQIGELEWFENNKMFRLVHFQNKIGTIVIENDSDKSCLWVEIDFPDHSAIHLIISRVRCLFDLDSDPLVIANALEVDPKIKKILGKHPGIRIPSGWDPFEVAISTILGQLVSVERGRSLVHDLITLTGSSVQFNGKEIKLFPTPQQIMSSDLTSLKTTSIRKQTLKNFATALFNKTISLEPTQNVDRFVKSVLAIKGIGPWTAHYMALKVLRHTDAFPQTDLILARALALHSSEHIQKMSPWRGYVAALFWVEYSQNLKKDKNRKINS